jgi:hypothetical protein
MSLPIDNPQDRAKAAKEPDRSSQAAYNQRQDANQASDESIARTGIPEAKTEDCGRSARSEGEEGRMKNETAVRQQSELRSERDHGYGSEYIGNEYKDVKVEDKEKKDDAA